MCTKYGTVSLQMLFPELSDNLLPFEGIVRYYPAFFSAAESDRYFEQLLEETTWKQEPIKIFGKEVMQPRLTAWYGDADKAYTYSGITMQPRPWTATLAAIKQRIETVAPVTFTSVLLNLYRDGQDSMGWHRDNERMLGDKPVIGSVSFGGTRTFQLRHYVRKEPVRSVPLTHGSFLLMEDTTQQYWEHRIPKTAKPSKPRINLTFRVIVSV